MGKDWKGLTYKRILDLIEEKKGLTFMQLDPPNYTPDVAGKIARIGAENGLDCLAVGGSLGAQGQQLDDTILQIKEQCDIPVILFPGNIATLSPHADAVYYLTMLNSDDPYWISGAQIAAAYPVKKMGIEVIPTSYIIVEPGMAVGWVGKAKVIPRNLSYLGAITALAGQYMGQKLVILESGGGSPTCVTPEMVAMTKKTIDIPLVVAGGVSNPERAYETIAAGADIIQVGSVFEKAKGDYKKLAEKFREITSAVAKGAKTKQ